MTQSEICIEFSVSQNFVCGLLLVSKLTTDSHILAHVNTEYPDDSCPKLKDYISELNLDSNESIPAAYVTMNCII